MHFRTSRTVFVLIFAIFVSVSATAATEGRRESGDWISRQINRIVFQLTKLFTQPLDDPSAMPPKP